MSFKIERLKSGKCGVVYSISGRIQREHTETLGELLASDGTCAALDLKEVTLVDHDAVRFLAACEAHGIELRNCPPYVREWIRQEAVRTARNPDDNEEHTA